MEMEQKEPAGDRKRLYSVIKMYVLYVITEEKRCVGGVGVSQTNVPTVCVGRKSYHAVLGPR